MNKNKPNYADYLAKMTDLTYNSIYKITNDTPKHSDFIETTIIAMELLIGHYSRLLDNVNINKEKIQSIIEKLTNTRAELDVRLNYQLSVENQDIQFAESIINNFNEDKFAEIDMITESLLVKDNNNATDNIEQNNVNAGMSETILNKK